MVQPLFFIMSHIPDPSEMAVPESHPQADPQPQASDIDVLCSIVEMGHALLDLNTNQSSMVTRLQSLTDAIAVQHWQQNNSQFTASMVSLSKNLKTLSTTVDDISNHSSSSSSSSSIKFNPPTVFTGNATEVKDFLSDIQNAITLQHKSFPSDFHRTVKKCTKDLDLFSLYHMTAVPAQTTAITSTPEFDCSNCPHGFDSRDQALAHFRETENSWFDCDHQPCPNASANQTVPEVIQLEGFQILPIAADLPPPAQPTPIPSPTKPDNPLFSDEPIDLDNMPAQPGSSSAPPPPMTTEQIIHALAEQVANLTAAVSGRAAAKSSMNKPDLFKGQSSTEARRFLAQFLAWASEQPDLKNNHGKTIKSALGFLTDKAADWATPYLNEYNNGRVPFAGLWPNFVAAFKLRFESVDPEMEARAAIETIHQGKGQSAAETLPKQPTPGNPT
ncbi:hypothetical protein D9757_004590 [Collybiopsis confluens]|uniref:Retrotransposon gag domain-containing protein n=1 Tax=Collybiopsis confluens TaxID=2823264 RepID=A0A8H5HSB2_9AGAR|nr:hypothetical protein D9757_004590 [Collybiopsis confluens]